MNPVSAETQATLDLLPDGIVIADAEGSVVAVNATALELLEIDPDAILGHPLEEALTLVDQDGLGWCPTNEPYGGLSTRTGVPEQPWLLPSGLEVLVNAKVHRESPCTPIESVVVSIRNGRGRARLDRERSDLVATVAHELRSPLTGVKGFVQALLNRWDKLNDDQRKLMLNTVNADADRLVRLIAELLDVARIDTGRLSLYRRESATDVLVTRVVDSVRAGNSRPIEVEIFGGDLTAFIDPDKFTQVITNLIENAVRHGTGTVRVSLRPLAGEHEWPGVRFMVDDEGEGIPEEMRRRVFTKFWKAGASGGSGLGMYIVNGLTRAHGGLITISDAPGGGARVLVDWPGEDPRA